MISNFLQYIQDASEIWSEIQISDRIRCTFECNKLIEDIEKSGFSIFGFRKDGIYSKTDILPLEIRAPMDMGVIVIKRSHDPRIIKNLNNDGIDILSTILPTEFQTR
jgi:hypothetical protein